jgi:hypothetical protein
MFVKFILDNTPAHYTTTEEATNYIRTTVKNYKTDITTPITSNKIRRQP